VDSDRRSRKRAPSTRPCASNEQPSAPRRRAAKPDRSPDCRLTCRPRNARRRRESRAKATIAVEALRPATSRARAPAGLSRRERNVRAAALNQCWRAAGARSERASRAGRRTKASACSRSTRARRIQCCWPGGHQNADHIAAAMAEAAVSCTPMQIDPRYIKGLTFADHPNPLRRLSPALTCSVPIAQRSFREEQRRWGLPGFLPSAPGQIPRFGCKAMAASWYH